MRIKDLKNQNVFEKVYNRDKWCKDNILIFTRICPEVTEEYKDQITAEDLGVKTFKDSIDEANVKAALALK